MLAEELAMVSLLMESIVISFALGGVVGAVVAIHLLYRKKDVSVYSENVTNTSSDQGLLPERVEARIKIPPRR